MFFSRGVPFFLFFFAGHALQKTVGIFLNFSLYKTEKACYNNQA